MSEGLFRKAAIDKVSSPEQLDLLMRVTSPVGWVALLTVAVIIVAVGVWSVVGSIPDLVDAQGLLIRGERPYEVKATISGTIVTLAVKQDSFVKPGQRVATLRRDRAAIEQRDADAVTIAKNRAAADRKRSELATLQEQRRLQQLLVDQGLKAPKDLLSLDLQINAIRGELDALAAEVRQLQAQAQATADVVSTEAGRVVSLIKSAGDRVNEGEPLVRIERVAQTAGEHCGGGVHAIVYFPSAVASKVSKGQVARVSPSGVTREEWGYIFGKVEWIASYPASTAEMTEKLAIDQVVRQFAEAGSVHEARVCLDLKPNAVVDPSGGAANSNPYRWSSSQGPPQSVDAGTTCSVSVVVDERKPYSYIIPAVKRTVGL